MLRRPRNAGLTSYGTETFPAAWPAIVPEATWRAVESILGDPQRRTNTTGNSRVRNVSASTLVGVDRTYELWRTRRGTDSRVFDTRYDIDHLPIGASRRLVDICDELKLDVTQPELARGYMTKRREISSHTATSQSAINS
jgi:hypothetical protein